MANPNAKLTISLIDKTKKGFQSISKSLAAVRTGVNRAGLGAAAAAGGFGVLTAAAFKSADALAKSADAIGINTEALAGYQFAASQTGLSNEQLDTAFKKLANSVGEANFGLGTAAPAFKELGLSAQSLTKLNPDQQFKAIADSIAQVADRSTQAALAQDIFGRQGIALLNTLDKGRAGIEAYQKEAELLGFTLTRFDAAQIEAANDAFDKLRKIFDGFFRQVAVKLSPIITGIANDLKNVILEAGGFQSVIDKAFSFAIRAAGIFANGIRGIQIAFNSLKAIAGLAIGGIASGLAAILEPLGRFNDTVASAAEGLRGFSASVFGETQKAAEAVKELTLSILPSEQIQQKISEYQSFTAAIASETESAAEKNFAIRAQAAEKVKALEQDTINALLSQQINYGQNRALLDQQLAERQQQIDSLSAQGKKDLAVGAFRETLAVASSGSKKLFEVNKKLALSEAVVNGFRAIQSGFATSPFFPVGLAMGALAAVKTATQIQGIKSQQFGSSGKTPTASAGGAAAAISAQSQQGQQTDNFAPVQGAPQPQRKAEITVVGEIDSREKTLEFAQNLVDLQRDGFTDLQINIGGVA